MLLLWQVKAMWHDKVGHPPPHPPLRDTMPTVLQLGPLAMATATDRATPPRVRKRWSQVMPKPQGSCSLFHPGKCTHAMI